MGSLTKGQDAWEQQIKAAIMDGYKRGVCDKEGRSEKHEDGGYIAKKRVIHPTYKKVYPRRLT